MQFSTSVVLGAVVAAVNAQAPAAVTATPGQTLKVTVGADGKLAYSPSNIIADVGTKIEFDFFPKNHTVTQSSFADPCHPLANGFFSGFVPTTLSPSGTTFTIEVKNKTQPIWFYCSQTTGAHCQAGMVGSINAPAVGNTLSAFILKAKNATNSTFPAGGPQGGTLATVSNRTTMTTTIVGSTTLSTATTSSTSYTTSAVTTSAVLSTYTSGSSTYTTTVGSTTIYTTSSSVVAASSTSTSTSTSSTSSPSSTVLPANGASAKSASLFGVMALMVGAVAFA